MSGRKRTYGKAHTALSNPVFGRASPVNTGKQNNIAKATSSQPTLATTPVSTTSKRYAPDDKDLLVESHHGDDIDGVVAGVQELRVTRQAAALKNTKSKNSRAQHQNVSPTALNNNDVVDARVLDAPAPLPTTFQHGSPNRDVSSSTVDDGIDGITQAVQGLRVTRQTIFYLSLCARIASRCAKAIELKSTESEGLLQMIARITVQEELKDTLDRLNYSSYVLEDPDTVGYTEHAEPYLPFEQYASYEPFVNIISWDDALITGMEYELEKVAEASFAEVYRAIGSRGEYSRSSIFKFIPLKTSCDRRSQGRGTAARLEDLFSEIIITDILADIKGFVHLKDVHIVVGKPPHWFEDNYNLYDKTKGKSNFPCPSSYSRHSAFLILEEADAGVPLEDFKLDSTDHLREIILQTVDAISHAEEYLEFEHRDLHENNICIGFDPKAEGVAKIQVTILDYGLSRLCATTQVSGYQRNEVFFNDLDQDLAIFQSVAQDDNPMEALQFKSYRLMKGLIETGGQDRNFQYENKFGLSGRSGSTINTWKQHHPGTNVIWLNYLYQYLIGNFKGKKSELSSFRHLFKEFEKRLNPKNEKAFNSAVEAAAFAGEHDLRQKRVMWNVRGLGVKR